MNFLTSILTLIYLANVGSINISEDFSSQKMVYDLPAPWVIELELGTATQGGDPNNPGSVPKEHINVMETLISTLHWE